MEFDLIERIRARAATRADVVLGIGDDAALLAVPPGMQLVVAMDTLNAGVHFPHATQAAAIGHKALAVNLSDLAAMGAVPAWCTLSLSLPDADAGWVDAFLDGFLALADAHGVALVGGDTTRGPLSVCVAVHGFVEPGRALRRDGARAGDDVWVSGTLGDAAAGLALVLDDALPASVDGGRVRHRASSAGPPPLPRAGEGRGEGGAHGSGVDAGDRTSGSPRLDGPRECAEPSPQPLSRGERGFGAADAGYAERAEPSPQPLSRGERGFGAAHVGCVERTGPPSQPDALEDSGLGGARDAWLRARLDRPTPRIALGRALAGVATSCIDVSDGLLADAGHLARASGVGLRIGVDALPASEALRAIARDADMLRAWQASGGDDYELCFTAPPAARADVADAARAAGVAVTRIGGVHVGDGVEASTADGARWTPPRHGYRHFA